MNKPTREPLKIADIGNYFRVVDSTKVTLVVGEWWIIENVDGYFFQINREDGIWYDSRDYILEIGGPKHTSQPREESLIGKTVLVQTKDYTETGKVIEETITQLHVIFKTYGGQIGVWVDREYAEIVDHTSSSEYSQILPSEDVVINGVTYSPVPSPLEKECEACQGTGTMGLERCRACSLLPLVPEWEKNFDYDDVQIVKDLLSQTRNSVLEEVRERIDLLMEHEFIPGHPGKIYLLKGDVLDLTNQLKNK